MNAGDAWVRRHHAYREVVRGWPERALLACSGGIDSSALLVLAGTAVRRGDLSPFPVVYVDHLTRPGSETDGEFVASLGARFKLSVIRTTVNPNDVESPGMSPEERLRVLRYAALARVAIETGSRAVVTAHTRNDQIETILMRLLSGASGLAAAGMAYTTSHSTQHGSVEIVRPMLDVERGELTDVLKKCGIEPIVDPTNDDRGYRRNAIRHDLIPLLQNIYPGFDSAMIRAVTLAARDGDALDSIADELATQHVRVTDDTVTVSRSLIRDAHPAVATRLIRSAASRLMPENQRELTFERIESVRKAVPRRTGATIELPYGVVACVERSEIVFKRKGDGRGTT